MACEKCEARGKTWSGSDPVCAFNGAEFDPANWNCATVWGIRQLCDGEDGVGDLKDGVDYRYCEDQHYATVKVEGLDGVGRALALWVTWYKQRGRTEAMWLLFDDEPPRRPTEMECRAVLAAYGI